MGHGESLEMTFCFELQKLYIGYITVHTYILVEL